MIKVIAFDFDGVLVDSNEIKRDAWKKVFEDRQDILPFLNERLAEERGTRFDILSDVLSRAGVADEKEQRRLVAKYAVKYDTEVKKSVTGLGVRKEVKETLKALSKEYALYINSATPDASLNRLVSELGLAVFFKEALGATSGAKEEHLTAVSAREAILPAEMVFVGDSESDRSAARACGVQFIGVPNSFNGWRKTSFPLLPEFSRLPSLVQKIT